MWLKVGNVRLQRQVSVRVRTMVDYGGLWSMVFEGWWNMLDYGGLWWTVMDGVWIMLDYGGL